MLPLKGANLGSCIYSMNSGGGGDQIIAGAFIKLLSELCRHNFIDLQHL